MNPPNPQLKFCDTPSKQRMWWKPLENFFLIRSGQNFVQEFMEIPLSSQRLWVDLQKRLKRKHLALWILSYCFSRCWYNCGTQECTLPWYTYYEYMRQSWYSHNFYHDLFTITSQINTKTNGMKWFLFLFSPHISFLLESAASPPVRFLDFIVTFPQARVVLFMFCVWYENSY